MKRCIWVNAKNPLYIKYHDEEWGVPVYKDDKLFEMLLLESFQAGLSWECILNKRESFKKAFDNFDYKKIKDYDTKKIEDLMQKKEIIRNKRKITATIKNAQIFIEIQKEYKTFSAYLWHFTQGKIIYEYDKTTSELSDKISKDLYRRGMRFVGSTIIYSYLQAVGVINSHDINCSLYKKPEKYVKVINGTKSGANQELTYEIGLINIAPKWNPTATTPEEMGGFNFSTEKKVLRWILRGDTLCEVELPEKSEVIEVESTSAPGGVFRSNKIILSNPRKIDDNLALELYHQSSLPWKSYIQILSYLASNNFIQTSKEIVKDKITKENAKEALEIYDNFLKNKPQSMPKLYIKIKEEIRKLQS